MPLSPKDRHTRDNLTTAAAALKEIGLDEEAQSVASMLTPAGAAFITRTYAERDPVPMPIYMPIPEKDHFMQSAAETGDNLSALGDQALYELVEGTFRPKDGESLATPYGTGGTTEKRGNLNLTIDKRLRTRAELLLKTPEFAAELGWKPRSVSALVRRYLHEVFPMFEGLDVAEAIEAYTSGESVADLADRYQADKDVIALMLERNGLVLREKSGSNTPVRVLSPAEKKEIIRRYDDNEEGTYRLAKEFGVYPRAVMRLLDKAGIERRKTHGKDKPKA